MEEYQERVIQEQKDLSEKIVKLTTFIMNINLKNINENEWELLNYQLRDMLSYNQFLQKRIYLFNN